MDTLEIFKFKLMNPSAPVLYDLQKIHKDNYPRRPVVLYVTAPAYKLCKYLNVILPEAIYF